MNSSEAESIRASLLAYLQDLAGTVTADKVERASHQPLTVRLRPKAFSEVIGQARTISNLERSLRKPDRPHVYLLHGPSGCGKTTLARIMAAELGAVRPFEIDTALHSGVDHIRGLAEFAVYRSLDSSPKVLILDECHRLSGAAWDASLKLLEEPPEHVFFVLCTTAAYKLPETVRQRATPFTVDPIKHADLLAYAKTVVSDEGLQVPEQYVEHAVRKAHGSVRRLLVALAQDDGMVESNMLTAAPSRLRAMIDCLSQRIPEGVDSERWLVTQIYSNIPQNPGLRVGQNH